MPEAEPPRWPQPQRVLRRRHIAMLLWRLLALLSFGLAILGALLPVLPTVPFLLVAAWAASRGWPQFEAWLIRHPRFGPPVLRWRERGAVSRAAKWLASVMMAASALLLQFLAQIPLAVRVGVPLFLLGMAIWLWRRPEE